MFYYSLAVQKCQSFPGEIQEKILFPKGNGQGRA